MRSVTVSGLSIQFDDDTDHPDLSQVVRDALQLINLTLQREPAGLCAQIMNAEEQVRAGNFEVQEWEEDEDQNLDDYDE